MIKIVPAEPGFDKHRARSARSTMLYRGFPSRLYHSVPEWVEPGAIFHIRIALDRTKEQATLSSSPIGESLMESAKFYDRRQRWYITVFQLMPDHIHALLSFPRNASMSRTVGDWKHFHAVRQGIVWQNGFFDHRLREDERGEQFSAKGEYIRQNPVAAGLCARAEDWPWWIERSALDDKDSAGGAGK
jgi:REP element-mobilizing transposase RayT